MKNYLFILLLCLALPGCAQEYSTIKGFVKGAGLKEVTLYKTVDGSPQVYATSRVGADGSYGFLLNPEPGFYSIGEERLNFPVYLKGGEQEHKREQSLVPVGRLCCRHPAEIRIFRTYPEQLRGFLSGIRGLRCRSG